MKIITPEESKLIDSLLQSKFGIDSLILMENAARDTLELLSKITNNEWNKYNFLIFSGTGNNGGDGIALARHLSSLTPNLGLFIVGDTSKTTKETQKNLEILSKIFENIFFIQEKNEGIKVYNKDKTTTKELNHIYEHFSTNTIIIDALVGVGVKGELRSPIKEVVEIINNLKEKGAKVISIDVPSGLNLSLKKNEVLKTTTAVKANKTITFFSIKAGMFFREVQNFLGEIVVSDLKIPRSVLESLVESKVFLLTEDYFVRYPEKDISGDKKKYGRVIFVCGSEKYTGALILGLKASTKTGVGYTIAITLEKYDSIVKSQLPEVISIPLPSRDRGFFSKEDIKYIKEIIKPDDVIAFGNGIGTKEETKEFTTEFLESFKENTIVLDADGINNLASKRELIKNLRHRENLIITPHLREFERISGEENVGEDPFGKGLTFWQETKVNLVLKDNIMYFYSHDGEIWISNMNKSNLAKGGSGDILAGLIGGNVAFTKDIKKGVLLSFFMLGKASTKAQEKYLTSSPSPVDIINEL
jgi:NAD(P)H-hydrate epimerase